MIAESLHALPQPQLDALLRAAEALADSGLAVVKWMRAAAGAEMDRRRGDIAVLPALPHDDGSVGPLAIAAIVVQFHGQDEFSPTVAFLEAVMAELHGRPQALDRFRDAGSR